MDVWEALKSRNPLQTALVFEQDLDLNMKHKNGDTLLDVAVRANNVLAVEIIIKKCGNINTLPYSETPPLMVAVYEEYTDIVKLLLESGADPNESIDTGETAVHMAGDHRNPAILELLEQYDGDMYVISGKEWDQHLARMFTYHIGGPH